MPHIAGFVRGSAIDFGSVALAIPSAAVTPIDPVHIVTRSARGSPAKVSTCLEDSNFPGEAVVAVQWRDERWRCPGQLGAR